MAQENNTAREQTALEKLSQDALLSLIHISEPTRH